MRSRVHISPQDVIRCDLCDTPVPTKPCDVCDRHLCEECEREHISDESVCRYMDFPELLQDVIRCDLCETPVPTKHCDVCDIHLCEECEGRHLSDESNEHVIVSFQMRGSTPKCSNHSTETCARYCKKCKTPICAFCYSLGKHKGHKLEDISKMDDGKKKPRNTELKTGTKFNLHKNVLEKIIPLICMIIIFLGVKFLLFLSVVPVEKIHLWVIVIVLEAILMFFLQDFLFFCLTHVCGIDFAPSHFFEYLKCLITKIKEPRKFNLQTATKFTPLKKLLKLIISYICIHFIDYGVRIFLILSVVPGTKIHLWLIVIVLNVILALCLVYFLFFCLKPVCGLDFIEFGYFFEYLKWLMTRTKDQRKNYIQTTIIVTPPEMSGRCVIADVCFKVIFSVILSCSGLILIYYFFPEH